MASISGQDHGHSSPWTNPTLRSRQTLLTSLMKVFLHYLISYYKYFIIFIELNISPHSICNAAQTRSGLKMKKKPAQPLADVILLVLYKLWTAYSDHSKREEHTCRAEPLLPTRYDDRNDGQAPDGDDLQAVTWSLHAAAIYQRTRMVPLCFRHLRDKR